MLGLISRVAAWFEPAPLSALEERRVRNFLNMLQRRGGSIRDDYDEELAAWQDEAELAQKHGLVTFGSAWTDGVEILPPGERLIA